MKRIDIRGIDKAALLAALFNAARFTGPAPEGWGSTYLMTLRDAQSILQQRKPTGWGARFWKLIGRPIYADLGVDDLNPIGYDRRNGPGAAAAVVAELRGKSP